MTAPHTENRKRKRKIIYNRVLKAPLLAGLCAAMGVLGGCGNTLDRLERVGKEPEMAKIENPILKKEYQPVSMPMPIPSAERPGMNSLWQPNRTTFFEDQRAGNVGDILTVLIAIDDEAEMENETERSRAAGENAGIPFFLGYQDNIDSLLPGDSDIPASALDNIVNLSSDSTHSGNGSIEREEEIDLRMAAVVTQVLPNGNLVISGTQEVRVNYEKRVLQVSGIIRPEDISIGNTINHDQIAEARIVYGGEGQLTDVQQARYGQQIYDILFPF